MRGPERRVELAALAVAAATALTFGPATAFDFVNFDDDLYVYDNPAVQSGLSGAAVRDAFTSYRGGNWHPLTIISHLLDVELFGMSPAGHHLTSVLLHALNVGLLFLALRRLTGRPWCSLLVAALFGLHPLRVESVVWISQRKDVLSTTFAFGMLLAYGRYAARPSVARYAPVVLLYALGLMSKPMVITMPCVLLLLDAWPLRRPLRAAVIDKIPLFALAAVFAVVTVIAQGEGDAFRSLDKVPMGARIANAVVAYVTYLGMVVWPADLAVLYPHPIVHPPLTIALCAAALLAITALTLKNLRTRRYLGVGWFWYLGMLVPVIGLIQVGSQALADRYTYVPTVGLAIMIVWGASELAERAPVRARVLGAAAVVAALGITTAQQLRHWESSVTLFEHTIAVTRPNVLARHNLALALEAEGQPRAALEHLAEALRINPGFTPSRLAMANVLYDGGAITAAIPQYEAVLRADDGNAAAHNNYGNALERSGRLEAAMTHYRRALEIDPDDPRAHNNIGVALARSGDIDAAIFHFRRALELEPGFEDAKHNLEGARRSRN